jgi:hypothetical protein
MAWSAITEANVLTRISGDELAAYRAAALGSGQADPVAPAIEQVTNLVRGRIGACRANTLGPAGTVPETLLGTALDLVVIEIIKRLPGVSIDAPRETAKNDALRLLEDVAACRFVVEEPSTGTTEKYPGQTPTYTETRTSQYNRSRQDGI